MCSFCGKDHAAVSVEMPSATIGHRQFQVVKPEFFTHYYTTSAVRHTRVTTLNQDILNNQLENGMQELFAEAFVEIQQELAHELASAFQKTSDLMAIVSQLRGRPKKAPPNEEKNGGGFMRPTGVFPERLLRTQQAQAHFQREQVDRMKNSGSTNPYERRKPSQQTIWHFAMQEPTREEADQLASCSNQEMTGVTCSCGSTRVTSTGNMTSRNSDMAKGETSGFKDRGDSLVSRYQCDSCGNKWNEED